MVRRGDDDPGGDAPPPRDEPPRADWPRARDHDPDAPVRPSHPLGEQGYDPAEISGHEEALPHEGELDYETDVEYLHRAIYREAFEPEEGREPTPWWVWAISALTIFWAGLYLGRHGGTFSNDVHLAYARVQGLVREEVAEQTANAIDDPIQAGQAIYRAHCQVCHQPDGSGMPGAFPPVIGAERVVGPPEGVVLIILHGLIGPVTVAGQLYNGAMPAWGNLLSDAEIAAVATYIRQWGTNQATPVDPELVRELRSSTADRTTPWTEHELDQELSETEP